MQPLRYLNVSFTIMQPLPRCFALCNTNLALWKLHVTPSTSNFSLPSFKPLIRKDSVIYVYDLAVYLKEGLSFFLPLKDPVILIYVSE